MKFIQVCQFCNVWGTFIKSNPNSLWNFANQNRNIGHWSSALKSSCHFDKLLHRFLRHNCWMLLISMLRYTPSYMKTFQYAGLEKFILLAQFPYLSQNFPANNSIPWKWAAQIHPKFLLPSQDGNKILPTDLFVHDSHFKINCQVIRQPFWNESYVGQWKHTWLHVLRMRPTHIYHMHMRRLCEQKQYYAYR